MDKNKTDFEFIIISTDKTMIGKYNDFAEQFDSQFTCPIIKENRTDLLRENDMPVKTQTYVQKVYKGNIPVGDHVASFVIKEKENVLYESDHYHHDDFAKLRK